MVPSTTGEVRKAYGWDRARLSIAVPTAIGMAIAIVCVVIAVLSAAQRADEVALDTERQLFTRALNNHGERVLREVEGIATSEAGVRNIRIQFDPDWVQARVGQRLQTLFDQNFVFVVDPVDQFLYARIGDRSVDPHWIGSIRSDIDPVLDLLRGRAGDQADAIVVAGAAGTLRGRQNHRAARLQTFLGQPAVVAAVVVAARSDTASYVDTNAPAVLGVKFIDEEVLTDIASRLQLPGLHNADTQSAVPDEYVFELTDKQGGTVGRFAWTPKRPGAEIVSSVIPFMAIVVAGFALLVSLMLRHIRRTAATIAAGESRLRHLALHDALCGLPNRISFGERLEATIEAVRKDGPPAAVLYIDLDHFKDVNDTLGHPIGDELIRNVTRRLTGALRNDDLVARIGGDEFAVITSTDCDHATLQTIADRLIVTLCTPYSINTHTVSIGASIGIALLNEQTGGAADVMRHADLALYRAKNEGRNRA